MVGDADGDVFRDVSLTTGPQRVDDPQPDLNDVLVSRPDRPTDLEVVEALSTMDVNPLLWCHCEPVQPNSKVAGTSRHDLDLQPPSHAPRGFAAHLDIDELTFVRGSDIDLVDDVDLGRFGLGLGHVDAPSLAC